MIVPLAEDAYVGTPAEGWVPLLIVLAFAASVACFGWWGWRYMR